MLKQVALIVFVGHVLSESDYWMDDWFKSVVWNRNVSGDWIAQNENNQSQSFVLSDNEMW